MYSSKKIDALNQFKKFGYAILDASKFIGYRKNVVYTVTHSDKMFNLTTELDCHLKGYDCVMEYGYYILHCPDYECSLCNSEGSDDTCYNLLKKLMEYGIRRVAHCTQGDIYHLYGDIPFIPEGDFSIYPLDDDYISGPLSKSTDDYGTSLIYPHEQEIRFYPDGSYSTGMSWNFCMYNADGKLLVRRETLPTYTSFYTYKENGAQQASGYVQFNEEIIAYFITLNLDDRLCTFSKSESGKTFYNGNDVPVNFNVVDSDGSLIIEYEGMPPIIVPSHQGYYRSENWNGPEDSMLLRDDLIPFLTSSF